MHNPHYKDKTLYGTVSSNLYPAWVHYERFSIAKPFDDIVYQKDGIASTFTFPVDVASGCVTRVEGLAVSNGNSRTPFGSSSKLNKNTNIYCEETSGYSSSLKTPMTQGCIHSLPHALPTDVDRGHIVAQELGGNNDDVINLFPQYAGSNRFNGRWKKWETALATALRSSACTDQIKLRIEFRSCTPKKALVQPGGTYGARIGCGCWKEMVNTLSTTSTTINTMVQFAAQVNPNFCPSSTGTMEIATVWENDPFWDDMALGVEFVDPVSKNQGALVPAKKIEVSIMIFSKIRWRSVTFPVSCSDQLNLAQVLAESIAQNPADKSLFPDNSKHSVIFSHVAPPIVASWLSSSNFYTSDDLLEVVMIQIPAAAATKGIELYVWQSYVLELFHTVSSCSIQQNSPQMHLMSSSDTPSSEDSTSETCSLESIDASVQVSLTPALPISSLLKQLLPSYLQSNPDLPSSSTFALIAFDELLDPKLTWGEYYFDPAQDPNFRIVRQVPRSTTSKEQFISQGCFTLRQVNRMLNCKGV